MVYGLRFMVYDLWFMVDGVWFMVDGLWLVVHGLWIMVHGMVCGPWFMVHGSWSMVHGPWFLVQVLGPWFMADARIFRVQNLAVAARARLFGAASFAPAFPPRLPAFSARAFSARLRASPFSAAIRLRLRPRL